VNTKHLLQVGVQLSAGGRLLFIADTRITMGFPASGRLMDIET